MKYLLIILIFIASNVQAQPILSVAGSKKAVSAPSGNIIYYEDFEDGSWNGGLGEEWNTAFGFTTVSSPLQAGALSGKFELRDGAGYADDYPRAEVRWPSSFNDTERWFSFWVYWPSTDFAFDSDQEIFHQTHQTSQTSPPLSMKIYDDRIYAEINGQVFSGVLGSGTTQVTDLGLVPKDTWTKFVFYYKFSYNTDGAWKIWKDGNVIFDHTGKTIYPPSITSNLPSFKVGIYKWPWSGSGSSETTKRVMYLDEVKMGDETCTYADM